MREARLRPEFAASYPGLEPGAWEDAASLPRMCSSEHLLQPGPGWMLSDRVLDKNTSISGAGIPAAGRGLPAHVAPIRRFSC